MARFALESSVAPGSHLRRPRGDERERIRDTEIRKVAHTVVEMVLHGFAPEARPR